MKQQMKYRLVMIFFMGMNIHMAFGQTQEVEQLMLNVEKLSQFKQILSDIKKGYQIISTGYSTISDLSKGNFSLHKTFLDGLLQVSPAVKKYQRVPEIINYQFQMVREYKAAALRFKTSGNFTVVELNYTAGIYKKILNESLKNLDDLISVLTAGELRMSDHERLNEIDRIYLEMENKLDFLRHFNNETSVLGLQRAKGLKDTKSIEGYYGIAR